jgi:superfamily II DNA/RNA helicase
LTNKTLVKNSIIVDVLVLLPTFELCNQVLEVFNQICVGSCTVCSFIVRSNSVPIPKLPEATVLITTPISLSHLPLSSMKQLSTVTQIVFDEADKLIGLGHGSVIQNILRVIGTSFQGILMSATLDDEVKMLRDTILHNPVSKIICLFYL